MTDHDYARAIMMLNALVAAAWAVIERWEHGDLAGAVRDLEGEATRTQRFLAEQERR